jgi:ABC-type transporter Mla maintaining outer membrane lipid asymmetry ATPase subunit MlaF
VREPGEVLVSLDAVVKDYRSLRPLRIQHLDIRENEILALLGLDQGAAEVLVNLIAGATLPDSGEVRALGRPTTAITDGATWLKSLDDFGIISERALLLEQMTTEQNLAVPLTLELENLPSAIREQIAALADETGIPPSDVKRFASALTPLNRMRVRLARAIAVAPRVVMAEHPNASLPASEVSTFAADLVRVATERRLGLLVITADIAFAESIAHRVLKLNPSSGVLNELRPGWKAWFRRGTPHE